MESTDDNKTEQCLSGEGHISTKLASLIFIWKQGETSVSLIVWELNFFKDFQEIHLVV